MEHCSLESNLFESFKVWQPWCSTERSTFSIHPSSKSRTLGFEPGRCGCKTYRMIQTQFPGSLEDRHRATNAGGESPYAGSIPVRGAILVDEDVVKFFRVVFSALEPCLICFANSAFRTNINISFFQPPCHDGNDILGNVFTCGDN